MDETESAARVRVVSAARAWLGTPFHDLARVKGIGVDCAQLVAAVYEEAGIVPHVDTGFYAPQFMLHSREERLVNFVLRYADESDVANSGDLVLYRFGKSYSHAAIVVDWPHEIIHAHQMSGKVVVMNPFAADLYGRDMRFFSVWGLR
jgi:cell wall-associated NlpC family hydrolase